MPDWAMDCEGAASNESLSENHAVAESSDSPDSIIAEDDISTNDLIDNGLVNLPVK